MTNEPEEKIWALHLPRLTIPSKGNTMALLDRLNGPLASLLWMIWTRCILVDSCLRSHLRACYSPEECPQTDTMGLRIRLAGQAVPLAHSSKTRNPQRMPWLGSMPHRHNQEAHDMPLWLKQALFPRRQMLLLARLLLLVSTYHKHSKLCSKYSSNAHHEDRRLVISTATRIDLLYEHHLFQIHLLSQFLLPIKLERHRDPTWLHKKPRPKGSKLCAWKRSNACRPANNNTG
jgi:hypothetical protein